jgi:ATP-dependent RNA helicase RhlE
LGYTTPSEIQEKSIPLLLKGKDILATSQTGTGKTASFSFPLLENLKEETNKRTGDERYKIKALILAPTRELVIQIQQKIEAYGENFSHKSVALYGGIKLGSQVSAIRAGANIAVGTTARVLDHVKNKSLNLSEVEIIILDEADKMLEMGFIDDIRKILAHLPKERHSVMFSATFPKEIKSLAKSFLNNPITVEIDKENLSAQEIKQLVHYVKEEEKTLFLSQLIHSNENAQTLVFSNTKLQADKIVEALRTANIKSSAIHGDKSQNMRTEALKKFKDKKIQVLVATDVAGRGIDILNLPYVINFELPLNNEDYVHRIGRTGRAGERGEAHSLVCKKEREQLKEIEKLINKKIEVLSEEKVKTNRKVKKEDKKKGINLKQAKELAEKMMGKDGINPTDNNKRSKIGSKSPKNKRHF